MAQLLSEVAGGTNVKMNVDGAPINFLIIQQGNPNSGLYDASCDGTWVWLNDNSIVGSGSFGSTYNDYENSSATSVSNNLLNRLDDIGKSAVKQVKIPYIDGYGTNGTLKSGADGLSVKGFLLSVDEVGDSDSDYRSIGTTLSYFSQDSKNRRDRDVNWWTRTPPKLNSTYMVNVSSNGNTSTRDCDSSAYWIMAFILDSNCIVDDDGTLLGILTAPSTITAPILTMQNQTAEISWTAVDGAESYILERNADNGGWTQIYSGANLSYTDTIGAWSTVQYRVKAGISSVYGDYATSDAISVVAASALVISGTDSDLGTLTGPVQYSVSSDTGNAITVTETVNGVALRTYTATSGQQQSIAIPDLPTGSGSITIKASVQASSGTVNQTRNWTYTKTAPAFPSGPFDIAKLAKAGKTQFPLTLAEAVKMPLGLSMAGLLNGNITDLSGNPVGVQIATGSYVGTGTYGANNPTKITFDFTPKIWGIFAVQQKRVNNTYGLETILNMFPWGIANDTATMWQNNDSAGECNISYNGNTVSIYGNTAGAQCNSLSYIYYYFAIGSGGGGN